MSSVSMRSAWSFSAATSPARFSSDSTAHPTVAFASFSSAWGQRYRLAVSVTTAGVAVASPRAVVAAPFSLVVVTVPNEAERSEKMLTGSRVARSVAGRSVVWALGVAVLLTAGCSSAGGKVATRAGDTAPTEVTTTTAAVVPGAPPTSAPVGTAASVAPTTTTVASRATGAVRLVAPATTVTTVAVTTTTGATTGAPTGSTTVEPAPTTTTVAPTTTTTRPLEKVSALSLGGDCPRTYFAKGVPEAVDLDKLRADLAAQGFAMPEASQFRNADGAVRPAVERNLSDAQQQWTNCANDVQGGAQARLTLVGLASERGGRVFAQLVKDQLDALGLKNYGGTTATAA